MGLSISKIFAKDIGDLLADHIFFSKPYQFDKYIIIFNIFNNRNKH